MHAKGKPADTLLSEMSQPEGTHIMLLHLCRAPSGGVWEEGTQ